MIDLNTEENILSSVFAQDNFERELSKGRKEEAYKILAEHLKTGKVSHYFLEYIAKELEELTAIKTRGAPKKRLPPNFIEIGEEYEQLLAEGNKHEKTQEILISKYKLSRSTIKRRRKLYQKAVEEHELINTQEIDT